MGGVPEFLRIDNMSANEYSVLPESKDVLPDQQNAAKASTTVDYMSGLDVLSRAARVRLSGIVCTIGPCSKDPEFLYDMMEAGMNIARMNFSRGDHKCHKQTILNSRVASDKYTKDKGFGIPLAIALDTRAAIRITTDDAFMEKCTKEILWVDYKNINKVLKPGKRMFIDDGLISVVAKEIGDNF